MVHISMDQGLSRADLTATVADRVVTLEGRTHTRDDQRRAVEIVRAIPGVKDVRATLRLFDTVIQEAVAAALQADPAIGKIPIAATVSHGVVRLESSATGPDDRSRAIEVTRAVDGVVKVDDFMR